ncbi:MAG: phage/plasmid primase, P4 family [Deltaproteobacteria bacterium]|nr:phage/plasmid primase, P4 family [Deltaproteobacteria bacterium]
MINRLFEEVNPTPGAFFDRGVNDRLSYKPMLIAEEVFKRVKIKADKGLLYIWNGKFWEEIHEHYIGKLIVLLLGNEFDRGRAENALYCVRGGSVIPEGRAMNDQVDWICIENGMFNLKTLELREHDPDFLATYILPISYDPDSRKTCTRWLEFMDESVGEEGPIRQLQEFLGYCLSSSTDYEKGLLLLGSGANGKSVFLKVMFEVVGARNCAAVSFQGLEDQFQRSSLYGKLLNISTEVGGRALESPFLKAIISGDPINAAYKHKNVFEFCPTCKLAFAANRLPRVLDNSDGYFRRLLPVQFKGQFFDGDADPFLLDKLKTELSEIFVWAVEGLHRLWEQNGFTHCEETDRILLDYRRGNNSVVAYVEDRCILGEEFEVSKRDIYRDYRSYCGESGYQMMNIENFFRELYAAHQYLKQYRPRIDGRCVRSIKGIKVNTEV